MNLEHLLLVLAVMLLGGVAASAQESSTADASRFWDLPAFKGRVELFTLTPRNAIDGLILGDGMEVKTAPYLSRELLQAVRPGDMVAVRGLKAASLPLIQAMAVEDETTGQTVVDHGPGAWPPSGGDSTGLRVTTAVRRIEGRIRLALHGPRGDRNGVLLDDGTVVRLPPLEALRLAPILSPDRPLVVDGVLSTSSLGAVMEASAVGASAERMVSVEAPTNAEERRP